METVQFNDGNQIPAVGFGVSVLAGVTIGENAIIGAGDVVDKDVPANSIAVGIPAKVIKTIPHPEQIKQG